MDYVNTETGEVQQISLGIGKLALALSKAQAAMKPAVRDADNPFFKSRYASLASIWESIREPLAANELAIVQTTEAFDTTLRLVTILAHSSGEFVLSRYPINPAKPDPQSIGSAITYARRYALAAIVGASTEDDDADSATERKDEVGHKPPPPLSALPSPNGATSSIDWTQFKYRYALPVRSRDMDMNEVRTWIKRNGFKFNPDDKHWYGNLLVEKLEEYRKAHEAGQGELPLATDDAPPPIDADDIAF
jgi:ERF superfamily